MVTPPSSLVSQSATFRNPTIKQTGHALTTDMYILYTSERIIIGQYQKQDLTDLAKLTRWLRQVLSNFIDALQVQIQLAPFYHAELQRKQKIPITAKVN